MKQVMIMVLVVLIMVFGVQGAVSAAPSDDIMTALKATDAPAVYFPQIEAYLLTRAVTAGQATTVITHINNADAIAAGVTKFADLSSTQAKGIFAEIVAAANVLNLTATYAGKTLLIKDSTGQTVISINETQIIKDTGNNYTNIFAGAVLLVAAAAVAIMRRKHLKPSRQATV